MEESGRQGRRVGGDDLAKAEREQGAEPTGDERQRGAGSKLYVHEGAAMGARVGVRAAAQRETRHLSLRSVACRHGGRKTRGRGLAPRRAGAIGMRHSSVGIVEESFVVKWQLTATEMRQAYALRADVFCREMEWVGTRGDPLERDDLDAYATHLAVVHGSDIVGTVRLAAHDVPWMLDGVFLPLLPGGRIPRGDDTVEASRLAVARPWRRARLENGAAICDLLYKATYAFCCLRRIRRVYMVTSDAVLRLMRRSGLPVTALAAPTRMPDGVMAVPLVLDWNHLARTCERHGWFAAVKLLAPCSSPSRSRDMESRRRASP